LPYFLIPDTVKRSYRNFGYGTVKSRCMVLSSVFHFTLLLVSYST